MERMGWTGQMGWLRATSGVGNLARLGLSAAMAIGAASLGGCRSDRPAAIPREAERVAGGNPRQARRFDYTCKTNGTVYVTDDWDNSLVYSGPVRAGDVVLIDVYAGQITVNGKTVYEHQMRHTDHLVYVAPSR